MENITQRPDGKPDIKNGRGNISISNLDNIQLYARSNLKIGCDIESIKNLEDSLWYKILDDNLINLTKELKKRTGEDLDKTATRVWSLGESLKKIGKTFFETVVIDKINKKLGLVIFESANTKILSLNPRINNENVIFTFSLE